MALKARLQKLEASLEAKKQLFLWLQHAKAAGGFVPYWEQELKGPLGPFEWLADEEVYFLWHLVNETNLEILKNAQVNHDLRSFAHCALDGILRQIARPNRSGVFVPARQIPELAERVGGYLYAKFRALLEESLSLAAAIDEVSETYLGGEDILFPDSRAALDAETSDLRKTADVFGPLAEWLKVEPITVDGFIPGHLVDAKASQLVNFARAGALSRGGTRRQFIDALQQAWPELAEGGQR